MRRLTAAVLLMCVAGWMGVSGCASGEGTPGVRGSAADANAVEALAGLMEGRFSSAAQAAAEPGSYLEIEVEVTRIEGWGGADEVYLYLEQSVAGSPPYRERVYRLSAGEAAGVVESRVLWLPEGRDLSGFVGAVESGEAVRGLTLSDLEDRGCVVELERAEAGSAWLFVGETRGLGCPSDFRGAVRATSEVWFGAERFAAWDRGWGPRDDQVWGPESGPYVFDRVE